MYKNDGKNVTSMCDPYNNSGCPPLNIYRLAYDNSGCPPLNIYRLAYDNSDLFHTIMAFKSVDIVID
jgi:hypothetical protein